MRRGNGHDSTLESRTSSVSLGGRICCAVAMTTDPPTNTGKGAQVCSVGITWRVPPGKSLIQASRANLLLADRLQLLQLRWIKSEKERKFIELNLTEQNTTELHVNLYLSKLSSRHVIEPSPN